MELIPNSDEAAYIRRMSRPSHPGVTPAPQHNTKELVTDIRKQGHMTKQSSLGVHLSGDLTWREKTREVVKKAQQRLFFLWIFRKFGLPQKLFTNFYQCTIVLNYGCMMWFSSSTSEERKVPEWIIKTALKIIGAPLPLLEKILYTLPGW